MLPRRWYAIHVLWLAGVVLFCLHQYCCTLVVMLTVVVVVVVVVDVFVGFIVDIVDVFQFDAVIVYC